MSAAPGHNHQRPSAESAADVARDARARALLFALHCLEEKKGTASPGGPDNAREESDERSRARRTVPQRR